MANLKKNENTDVAILDLNTLENDAGKGLENVTQEDLALPFLKVLSRQDPVLDDLENAKAGDILNTVTNEVFSGKEGVKVIPSCYQRRFIEWSPRGVGTGAPVHIFTPADDRPKTERSQEDNKDYVVGGSGNYIEETHQHYVVIIDKNGNPSTALIAMKSTQLKKSRKWNSMIQSRMLQGKNGLFQAPRFSHVYLLKTVSEENSKGSWHGWDISLVETVQDINLYNQAKVFAESVTKGDVQVKHQQDSENSDDVPF